MIFADESTIGWGFFVAIVANFVEKWVLPVENFGEFGGIVMKWR
jgi:hypothetical protein